MRRTDRAVRAEWNRWLEMAVFLREDLKHRVVRKGHGCAEQAEQRESTEMKNIECIFEKS